ncbi:MAG: hypothetical protein JWO71_29 [Candidatus Acidoferrum typicum]|nr:hypothetical protein [Candidatus Acidoferrum typicum]
MATSGTNTVIGYFETRSQAEKTIEELTSAGFRSEQLGMATHSDATGASTTGESTTGEKAESLWDKVVHFFGGRSDYDYNPDDFRGSLEYAGVTKDRARYFEHQLAQGDEGALVTVSTPGREREAEQVIEQNGGDVGRDATTFNYPATSAQSTSGERRRIQLLGEVLRVHKERVPLGEVRVHKEVVTETQNVQVPTSREELVIERHPAGEGAPAGEIGAESEIRVPLSEERVNVEKKSTVREEVEVGKRTREDTREVSEKVRREELRVDKDENVNVEETGSGDTPKTRKRGA